MLAGAAGLAAVATVVVARGMPLKPYRVPSESMVPTIEPDERIVVERLSYRFEDPERGDVVVTKAPRGADSGDCGVEHPLDQACPKPTGGRSGVSFVKRIVGLPGERLKVVGGQVHVNGAALEEGYARLDAACLACNLQREITIPADHYFMMGDNRGESADSREWGPVPGDWIVGKVLGTYWPPGRIGGT